MFVRLLPMLCAALIGISSNASAVTIDVGTGGIEDCTFACTERYQQVYAASILSLVGPY